MILAHLHDCARLRGASMDLVVKHAPKFMAQDDWPAFTQKHPELLSRICHALATRKK